MKLVLARTTVLKSVLVAAGCVLATSLVVGREGDPVNVVESTARSPAGGERRTSDQVGATKAAHLDLDLSRLDRVTTVEIEDALFPVRVPKTPPLPLPARAVIDTPPPPPPKPVAPPLPFKYLGMMIDRGQLVVFVAQGEEYLSLRQGDVVENLYRVDEVDEASMTFVYLPLDEKQALSIGERK